MGRRWTAPGGWDVEFILLDRRPCYRVRQHGVLVGYAYSETELAVLLARCGLDPGDLTEAEAEDGDEAGDGDGRHGRA